MTPPLLITLHLTIFFQFLHQKCSPSLMTHVHVCCTRAHASHICINQKAGGEIWSIQSWWCVKGQEDLQLEAFTCISIIRSAVTAGAQTGASAELLPCFLLPDRLKSLQVLLFADWLTFFTLTEGLVPRVCVCSFPASTR